MVLPPVAVMVAPMKTVQILLYSTIGTTFKATIEVIASQTHQGAHRH
jgi:hypothetical protein